jgi:hypothetical protein
VSDEPEVKTTKNDINSHEKSFCLAKNDIYSRGDSDHHRDGLLFKIQRSKEKYAQAQIRILNEHVQEQDNIMEDIVHHMYSPK